MLTSYRKSASLRTLSSSAFFRFFNSFPDSRNSPSSERNLGECGSSDIKWYRIGLSETTWFEGRADRGDLLRPKSMTVCFARRLQRWENEVSGDGTVAWGYLTHTMLALNVAQIRIMPRWRIRNRRTTYLIPRFYELPTDT